MYICNCSPLTDHSSLAEIREFFKIHYYGVPDTLTLSKRQIPLSVSERQARMYKHRMLFRQAVKDNQGFCPSCGKEPQRFSADFDHLGNFRGALCRQCMEMAALIDYDLTNGDIVWWTNPAFCQMAAGYIVDWCRAHAVEHTDSMFDVCVQCLATGRRWTGLGRYLAKSLGIFHQDHALWHNAEPPAHDSGAGASAPAPLFLAPEPSR